MLMILGVLNGCNHTITIEEGYLFVDFTSIYYKGNEFTIFNEQNLPIMSFKNKDVIIGNKTYDIINEEHLYRNLVNVIAYYPENGLFILKASKLEDGNYEVNINDSKGTINASKYNDLLTFKTAEKYVLDGYPNPTKENPLRVEPDDTSSIVTNYEENTYISIEVKGDWLKVKDDKNCYPGEKPSEKDIVGWLRWKKDGKIIIDIRHIC